jgi:hypothetical protein
MTWMSKDTLGRLLGWFSDERLERWVVPVSLAGLTVGMVLAHLARAYTSDDTAPLNIVAQWLAGHHHVAYFGSDTYIIKFPLYWLVQEVLPHSRTAILLIILVLNLLGFWLFAVAARYFLRKFRAWSPRMFLVSMAWLVALGSPFLVILMNPHARNLEIGMAFYLVMLLDRLLSREGKLEWRRMWWQVAGGVALTVALLYDDPYFLITVGVPAGLALAWKLWQSPRDRRVWLGLGALAGSYCGFKVVTKIFEHLGVEAHTGLAQFIGIHELPTMLLNLLDNTLSLFRANFFGLPFYSKYVIAAVFSLIVLGIIVRQLVSRGEGGAERRNQMLVFGLIWWLTAAAYTLSTFSDANAIRYLILLPFVGVLFLNLAYSKLAWKSQMLLVAVVLLSATFNGLILARDGVRAVRHTHPNSTERAVIDAARAAGVSKGYATYWSGNIITYLGAANPTVVAVQCTGAKTGPYYWLADSANLDVPAARTFYLLQSDPAREGCSLSDVEAQFGQPEQTVQIDGGDQLLIYPYDLKQRMQL